MNIYFAVGRLTKEPEQVQTNGDKTMCKFTLAVNENYTQADGKRPVNFLNCIGWNAMAERCLKYLHKGSLIGIVGKLQVRNYEDAQGNKKTATEVVLSEVEFLSRKNEETPKEAEPVPMTPIDDEGLPF